MSDEDSCRLRDDLRLFTTHTSDYGSRHPLQPGVRRHRSRLPDHKPLFENSPPGWARVQAICDCVHRHVAFGYEHARPTMTAYEVFNERKGVCRDYAHLAITFCRCMNIPARYCTGYLGDIGMPPPYGPMDFAGWFEAYLGGRWYTFDPRNNMPRIGRVLIAQGRDAADVPITHTFGPGRLANFKVWTDEVS
jgi:transglutaminase-like putative cysteine protease